MRAVSEGPNPVICRVHGVLSGSPQLFGFLLSLFLGDLLCRHRRPGCAVPSLEHSQLATLALSCWPSVPPARAPVLLLTSAQGKRPGPAWLGGGFGCPVLEKALTLADHCGQVTPLLLPTKPSASRGAAQTVRGPHHREKELRGRHRSPESWLPSLGATT